MKVLVLAVGRVKEPLRAAVDEYEGRARRYWRLDVVEVEGGVRGAKEDPARVTAVEGERLLARLPPGLDSIALTRAGDPIDSAGLARLLGEHALRGAPGVAFVIGGAHGLGEGVLERARRRLSLSALTFPHELARLVLAEQLYRAGTILRGEPYHKGGQA